MTTSDQTDELPELVFALVGAVGTDLARISDALVRSVGRTGYTVHQIHLIELLFAFQRWRKPDPSAWDGRITQRMNMGNEFRELLKRGDALALLTMLRMQSERNETVVPSGRAWLLRSLKHPDEVRTLRETYGDNFFLIGAYTERERRIVNLASEIAQSQHASSPGLFRDKAEALNNRDESEKEDNKLGQNVRDTFPFADVFINCSNGRDIEKGIERFVEIVFDHPNRTPTRDEHGMFHAYGAALRSGDLSRQVGAAITTIEGDIVALGTNEVPKARGGQYWTDDTDDRRDYHLGYESNNRVKRYDHLPMP